MTRPLTAYLVLERLMMDADEENDSFADLVRDQILPFWNAMDSREREALKARRGPPGLINPTVIRTLRDSAGVPRVAVFTGEPYMRSAVIGSQPPVARDIYSATVATQLPTTVNALTPSMASEPLRYWTTEALLPESGVEIIQTGGTH